MDRYNQAISRCFEVDGDLHLEMYLYEELRKIYPQINEKTKVQSVLNHVVYIAEMKPVNYFETLIRVPVSGWKLLSRYLFWRGGELDDPNARWEYTTKLWKSAFYAPVPLFWRVAGTLFRRPKWYNRGTEMQPDPIMPQPKFETLELKRYGWNVERHSQDWRKTVVIVMCGYWPQTDTFYYYGRG